MAVYFQDCLLSRPSIFMTVHFELDLINLVESSLKPWWHKLEANLKLFLWVRLVDLWTAFSSLFIHTFVPLEVVSLDPRDYQPLLYYVITLYLLVLITSLKDIIVILKHCSNSVIFSLGYHGHFDIFSEMWVFQLRIC